MCSAKTKRTPNPHKGQKFDSVSYQWLPNAEFQKLQTERKTLKRAEKLQAKPYSRWTKSDKAFAEKNNTRKIRQEKAKVAKTESHGLKSKGYGNINPTTAKGLLFLMYKYPQIAGLSTGEQKNLEYGISLLADHKRKHGYKKAVTLMINKSINKESGIEKGKWMTGDDVKYTTDLFESWGIPESEYSAVYGSDVI